MQYKNKATIFLINIFITILTFVIGFKFGVQVERKYKPASQVKCDI